MNAISMEAFGPVSVDYFVGRRVEKVAKCKGDGEWKIIFEGGGEIVNYEKRCPTPKAIVGAALSRVFFDGDTKTTRLHFGLEEVVLNPIEYAISDPNYTKGQLVFAQRSEYNMPINHTPEHPDERVADGPEPQPKQPQVPKKKPKSKAKTPTSRKKK